MIFIENLLLEEILCNNKAKAFYYYNQIFNNIDRISLNSSSHLRAIKNYLIVLNSILYQSTNNSTICQKSIFDRRNYLVKEIEKQNQIKDLYKLGEEIVLFYLNVHHKKCFQTNNPVIDQALDYIHNNLDKDLTLDTVSKAINISSNYLSSLFPKLIGSSFSDYINTSRIEKSKLLLKGSRLSMLDIAMECGFSSQSYFCYVFKRMEKMTPKEYRRKTCPKK